EDGIRDFHVTGVQTCALPISLREFMQGIEQYPPTRVAGTAVFMSMIVDTVPPALLHNLKHNKVLHEQVVFLTVHSAGVPYVSFKIGRASCRESVRVALAGGAS